MLCTESPAPVLTASRGVYASKLVRQVALVGHEPPLVMRWVASLRGEHDCANEDDLVGLLSEAIAVDDGDLVVDLHDVTFMGASTLGVLVATRSALAAKGRTLVVRSPSRMARRLFDICGLSDLIEVSPETVPG